MKDEWLDDDSLHEELCVCVGNFYHPLGSDSKPVVGRVAEL